MPVTKNIRRLLLVLALVIGILLLIGLIQYDMLARLILALLDTLKSGKRYQ